jgi:hypothetical protein
VMITLLILLLFFSFYYFYFDIIIINNDDIDDEDVLYVNDEVDWSIHIINSPVYKYVTVILSIDIYISIDMEKIRICHCCPDPK